MSTPAAEQFEAELERRLAERTADLVELLGHQANCWDDERRLLARKLHDSLGSSMTALTMHLALLTRQLPQENALQERSKQMKTLLMNIIEANRELQLTLWNDKLEFLGIKPALCEAVEQFCSEHKLVARVSLPDEDGIYSREHGVALLRSVEEGLRNVLQHASATEVDVILDDNEDEIMLTVRDNGVGPGLRQPESLQCHGLRMLRQRARHLGGELSFRAGPQQGSVLTVTLPRHPLAQA
ncbi:MAG: ATP-binding protein [Pseudomonadota bacterium]